VQFDAITRLRLAFVALGVILFLPLLWLIHSVDVRVEAQRRLRHQVVAERIFDELERELTRVLDQESARASASFDLDMPSSSWEPYVIGYFKTDGDQNRLLDAPNLDPERRKRLSWALAHDGVVQPPPPAQQLGELKQEAQGAENTQVTRSAQQSAASAPAPKAASASSLSPADVLRKLNRAKEERQQQAPAFSGRR